MGKRVTASGLYACLCTFQGVFHSKKNVMISIFISKSASCHFLLAYFHLCGYQPGNMGFSID